MDFFCLLYKSFWRELQEKDLHCTLDRGTTVQCNTCGKWRILKDCQDPSLVPEVWVCSMNQDVSADSCSKESTILPDEEEDDLMDVKFGLGSIVWAKFQGRVMNRLNYLAFVSLERPSWIQKSWIRILKGSDPSGSWIRRRGPDPLHYNSYFILC